MTSVVGRSGPSQGVQAQSVSRTVFDRAANTPVFQRLDPKTGEVILQLPDTVRVENMARQRAALVDRKA